MSEGDGLVCAYVRDQDESWREIGWTEVEQYERSNGLLWVHLDRTFRKAKDWLETDSNLDPLIIENLLAEETRPRALEINGNLLINLRGVNLNPGADPEDMVSLRLWLEPNFIVTSRHRPLMAVNDIRERIAKGHGPINSGEFLIEVANRLVERMSPIIEMLDEVCDDLENLVVTGEQRDIRSKLTEVRKQAISLRRYLAPQREAMSRILGERLDWLELRQKAQLREIADRVTRYVEDLDAIRERASVIQDEIANRVSESMNKNMYVLTIVATIMLPLGFITGLLGINVDGLPGSSNSPWAFWSVTIALFLMAILEIMIMRRLKWF